jgi:hypothetical protein
MDRSYSCSPKNSRNSYPEMPPRSHLVVCIESNISGLFRLLRMVVPILLPPTSALELARKPFWVDPELIIGTNEP